MTSKTPLIQTRRLTKIYGAEQEDETTTIAIKDIDFTVADGEFVSIIGPSGSGKSTLLHLIGLLDRPTSGQYLLNGEETEYLSDAELAHLRNQTIGFVFQSFHLLPRATVLENTILPLQYSSRPAKEHRQQALSALAEVSMTHRL